MTDQEPGVSIVGQISAFIGNAVDSMSLSPGIMLGMIAGLELTTRHPEWAMAMGQRIRKELEVIEESRGIEVPGEEEYQFIVDNWPIPLRPVDEGGDAN